MEAATESGIIAEDQMIDQVIEQAIEIENEEPKLAFLVIGPEGSGGYMLTEALVSAGCYWEQDFQNIHAKIDWGSKPWPLVVHRSWPHAKTFPNLRTFSEEIRDGYFNIHILLILRDFNATAQSGSRRNGDNIAGAYNSQRSIFCEVNDLLDSMMDFTYITYEAFTTSEGFRRWLFEERLQLPYPADYNVENRNLKYYEEEN